MHKARQNFSPIYFNWNTLVGGHKQGIVDFPTQTTAKVTWKLHSQ